MKQVRNRLKFYATALRRAYGDLEAQRAASDRFPHARLERGVRIVSPDRLSIGENVLVQRDTILHCGGLDWSGGAGEIVLRESVTISPRCVIWGAGGVTVGPGCEIGPGCMLMSSETDYRRLAGGGSGQQSVKLRSVVLGKDVILYAGVTVTPGVTVGDRSVVAAGSVVVSDIPSLEMWAGVPARRIKSLAPSS